MTESDPGSSAHPRVDSDDKPQRLKTVLGLSFVVIVAGILRFVDLAVPDFMIFDEVYYAPDACRYVTEGQFLCGRGEITYAHPPVAKWLIAAGIWAFGPTAFGTRLMPALVGTLSVGVLFLLARRLLRTFTGALVAAGLLAIDFLHLVTSRVAILEIVASFFVLLGILFLVYDLEWRAGSGSRAAEPDLTRYFFFRDIDWTRFRWAWRWLAGVALGLAIGAKWTMAPVLLGVISVAVADARRRLPAAERGLGPALRSEGMGIFLALVVTPFLAYTLTFVGRVDAPFLVTPWDAQSWFRTFAARHVDMLEYHLHLREELVGRLGPAYESSPWAWPLIQRPIPYAFSLRGDTYREILAMGNPVVWWPSLIGIAFILLRWRSSARQRLRWIIAVGFGGTYLYWLLVLPFGLNNVFMYYFVAAVPFLCLAMGAIGETFLRSRGGMVAVSAYLAAVLAAFVFFYPVLTWKPLSHESFTRRMLFSACERKEFTGRIISTGIEFEPFRRETIEAYPKDLPLERDLLPLYTRGGWCWY